MAGGGGVAVGRRATKTLASSCPPMEQKRYPLSRHVHPPTHPPTPTHTTQDAQAQPSPSQPGPQDALPSSATACSSQTHPQHKNMGIQAHFVDPIDEELNCGICHMVMDKPVSHCQQGHTYCRACIKSCTYYALSSSSFFSLLCTDPPPPNPPTQNSLTHPPTHSKQTNTGLNRPNPNKGSHNKPPPKPHCPGCMLPIGPEVRNIVAEVRLLPPTHPPTHLCVCMEVVTLPPIHPLLSLFLPNSHNSTTHPPTHLPLV